MTDSDRYEVLVIGSGEAGKYMAWTMAKTGHRTAVIERKLVGGSCPNVAWPGEGLTVLWTNVHAKATRQFA